jgi:predicted S18 family serine protease
MPSLNESETLRNRCRTLFAEGRYYESGEILSAQMKLDEKVAWSAAVLEAACSSEDREKIEFVLKLAADRDSWKSGHGIFNLVRNKYFQAIDEKASQNVIAIYSMAEFVAKACYNATFPSSPFDKDSGGKMAMLIGRSRSVLGSRYEGVVDVLIGFAAR